MNTAPEAYLRVGNLVSHSVRLGPCKQFSRPERPVRDKHSSLFSPFINYEEKGFITLAAEGVTTLMIACQQGLEHDVRNIIRKKVGQPIYLKKKSANVRENVFILIALNVRGFKTSSLLKHSRLITTVYLKLLG